MQAGESPAVVTADATGGGAAAEGSPSEASGRARESAVPIQTEREEGGKGEASGEGMEGRVEGRERPDHHSARERDRRGSEALQAEKEERERERKRKREEEEAEEAARQEARAEQRAARAALIEERLFAHAVEKDLARAIDAQVAVRLAELEPELVAEQKARRAEMEAGMPAAIEEARQDARRAAAAVEEERRLEEEKRCGMRGGQGLGARVVDGVAGGVAGEVADGPTDRDRSLVAAGGLGGDVER